MPIEYNPLTLEPRPLLFSQHKIVLTWAPKSACSQALVWFLIHESLLKSANEYSTWPHNFRTQVYYDLPRYKKLLTEVTEADGKGYTLIRVTRDPIKRLVSCFRHAVRFPAIDALVKQSVGHDPAKEGLSLTDFHQALKGKDLYCWNGYDMHVCLQQHPVWYKNFDRVITLNADDTDLFTGLNQIEKSLGMKKTQFDIFPKFRNLARGHHANDIAYTDDVPIAKKRLLRENIRDFPKSALLASPKLATVARDLHGRDFDQVASGDTKGELFTSSVKTG